MHGIFWILVTIEDHLVYMSGFSAQVGLLEFGSNRSILRLFQHSEAQQRSRLLAFADTHLTINSVVRTLDFGTLWPKTKRVNEICVSLTLWTSIYQVGLTYVFDRPLQSPVQ